MYGRSVLAVGLVSVLAVGCGGGDGNMTKVVVGAVIDQTGNNSELSWLQAIQLAVANMNDALAAEGNYKNFRFSLAAENSENDVTGGESSRAITRIRDVIVNQGAKAVTIDTTQISEEANKPQYAWGVPLQCSSCTGGSLLNATSSDPDPQLQAARRNDDRWMSRTIMSTSALSVVMAQLIAGAPNRGDLNNDGHLKIEAFGSNESFGQSTTNAIIAEIPKHYPDKDASWFTHERVLHDNLTDYRQIDFQTPLDKMTDHINDDLGGADDGYPDYIIISTFARNDTTFVSLFKDEGYSAGTGSSGAPPIKLMHFHTFRFSSNLLVLGEQAEGEEGVSHVLLDGPTGDDFAADFKASYGLVPQYRDGNYYDNSLTLLLAILMAMNEANVENPNDISGDRIRDFVPCTSAEQAAPLITDRPTMVCPNNGDVVQVGPGVESIRNAIRAISTGTPIEYTGASGPVNYDSRGNIKDKAAHYIVQNGQYVDVAAFDCIASTTTCPCTSGTCPTP